MSKPIYRMSEAGECPRVLGAMRLGYEPPPRPPDDEARLRHYSRCEALAAAQIVDEGYRLEPSLLCHICEDRYGVERYGIHVEIDTPLFLLLGHLDRRLIPDNDRRLPVEIKSLGRFSYQDFYRHRFDKFSGYAGQEACYLEAEQSPGIYWVMNRDSGEHQKYIVNDFNNEINLDGFERITLPIKYGDIIDKLNMVELCAQDSVLPEAETSDACRWCQFKYLCIKSEEEVKAKIETLPSLVEAAELYKQSREFQKLADERKEQSTFTFLQHSKVNNIDKFKVAGVSFTYSGEKTRSYIDERLLKELVNEDIVKRVTKQSKPYDSYTVRVLKEAE